MKISIVSVLLSIALLSRCHLPLATASALGRTGDFSSEQDVLTQLLGEEAAEGRDEGPRVIIVGDASLWGTLQALERVALPHPAMPESLLGTTERRDTNQEPSPNFSIMRRDTMRCMVGRVYRPCWEV
ncbi:pro-melanin-concentrating hormone, like [Clupea harengus]|uniref:Pro-melanin-concentrating hormone, like n=1 Tax=Clupea harengus TaxID=7950 RepID=A0A6P3W0Y5_CLUHA|nr:pro-melanin-concentrating hormone, like [Clupea harengus]